MRQKLFIDTWAWLTLWDKKEARHQEVKAFYQSLQEQKGIIYTSDYILDETLTLLFRRLHFRIAKECLESLEEAFREGYLHLEHITPERFEKAKALRLKFDDKPWISFTDLTSMVVMADRGIERILTEDEHFIQAGMGFQKLP